MKTLITGGKSAQAFKISKAFPAETLILADYGSIPTFSSAKFQLVSLGERNDTIIAHNLLTHCLDLQVEILIPLYSFELDAILRSVMLFEEFNIRILLPEKSQADQFLRKGTQTASGLWAAYQTGQLIYASDAAYSAQLTQIGVNQSLNGVFQVEILENQLRPYLFQIES